MHYYFCSPLFLFFLLSLFFSLFSLLSALFPVFIPFSLFFSFSHFSHFFPTFFLLFFHHFFSYAYEPTPSRPFELSSNFSYDRNWHSIIHFSHFFLGPFFIVMIFLFLFRFWEIKDYTDKEELERWLKIYAGKKYWRIGGIRVFSHLFKGCFLFVLWIFFLYSLSKQFTANAIPESRIIGEKSCLFIMPIFYAFHAFCFLPFSIFISLFQLFPLHCYPQHEFAFQHGF